MVVINGRKAIDCTKEQLISAIEGLAKQRDNLRLANTAINGFIASQEAEIQLLKTELSLIKEEIQAIDALRRLGSAN